MLRHFKEKLSKNHFIEIYSYFMNNYIKNNSYELIELNLLLDIDIIRTIINQNLLKTNKISLDLTSLNFLINKDIYFNFKDNKNIEQIYFNIISEEEEIQKYNYNKLYFTENIYYTIYYLLVLKYYNKYIPKNIKKIGISSVSEKNILENSIIDIFKKLNHLNNEIMEYKDIMNLLFDELAQYKNIKSFEFDTSTNNINTYLNIFNKDHSFFKNLDEIKLEIYIDSENNNEIALFKKLIQKDYLQNKLNINLIIDIHKLEEIKYALDSVKFSIEIYGTKHYKKGEINIIFPNKISNLYFSEKINDLNKIIQNLQNLKVLRLDTTYKDFDFNAFKYLINIEELWIRHLYLKDCNIFNDIFSILNKI